jgi:hypothetical protein
MEKPVVEKSHDNVLLLKIQQLSGLKREDCHKGARTMYSNDYAGDDKEYGVSLLIEDGEWSAD